MTRGAPAAARMTTAPGRPHTLPVRSVPQKAGGSPKDFGSMLAAHAEQQSIPRGQHRPSSFQSAWQQHAATVAPNICFCMPGLRSFRANCTAHSTCPKSCVWRGVYDSGMKTE